MRTRRFQLAALLVAMFAMMLAPLAVASADSGSRAEARAERRAQRDARRQAQAPQREAREFRRLKVQGETLASNVDRVNEMAWNQSLSDALATAGDTGRLVLHIQALGDLDGFL